MEARVWSTPFSQDPFFPLDHHTVESDYMSLQDVIWMLSLLITKVLPVHVRNELVSDQVDLISKPDCSFPNIIQAGFRRKSELTSLLFC